MCKVVTCGCTLPCILDVQPGATREHAQCFAGKFTVKQSWLDKPFAASGGDLGLGPCAKPIYGTFSVGRSLKNCRGNNLKMQYQDHWYLKLQIEDIRALVSMPWNCIRSGFWALANYRQGNQNTGCCPTFIFQLVCLLLEIHLSNEE